jgi:hypothetical protein
MAEALDGRSARQEVVDVIRKVRRRWRSKLLVRGAIVVVGGAFLALVLASWALAAYKFSPWSVTTFRIALFAVVGALVAWWVFKPLRRQVTDLQVALYIEEQEPSLQAAILSAVDAGATGTAASTAAGVPPAILERLVEQAVDRCRSIAGGREVARAAVKRHAVLLGAIAAGAALLLVVGPQFLRQGASALLILSRNAEAASPYAIKVGPGDVTVPKGSDQIVKATLSGFQSNNVAVMARAAGESDYSRLPLVASSADAASFEGMLFNIAASTSYYVEADGVRSPTYTMNVVELPAVENLELEYVYPAYTGRAPEKVESAGDVAALRGTEVRVHVKSTMTTPGGSLNLDPGSPSALTPGSDGTLSGAFTIGDDGFYQVELIGPHGEHVPASPKFTIDAIDDQAPTVSFDKPKRDVKATPLEEVPLQARADDDFGVKSLDLIYSVNGGPEKTVSLYGKGAKPMTQVSGGQTMYLEEMGVEPGDFVSYYAKATDTDTVKGPKTATSDIYFIEVRPFDREFHASMSQGQNGGGMGGGMGSQAGAMSERQRQIIAATFNLERDRPKTAADKFKEDAVFVGLSQRKLREEVDELVGQMRERLGSGGSDDLQQIAALLPKASAEMKVAEGPLADQKPKDALAPEQRALKFLQEAEQLYELQVQQGGGGGGGGGGGNQMASELADLFQLQLDRMANQYETEQRADQQSLNQQVDEIAERLNELARRQLQQAEQMARARGQQSASSGGGAGQRALADQVEQAARQLEQLRREAERQGQTRQDLADAARRLQESANEMRRAAANGANDGGAQARQAAERLQDAQRLLQQNQQQAAGQNARDAADRADQLVRQQQQIASGVQQATRQAPGAQQDQALQQLGQQKDALASGVGQLEQQLDALGQQALAAGQRDAARQFQEAASRIRDRQLKEIIDYSKQAMRGGPDMAGPVENRISSDLAQLQQRIGDALSASDQADRDKGEAQAARQAADLLRGLSSLQEQMNQRLGDQPGQGQQGQGQQGQQAQGGQQGQQGQGQQGQGQGQGQQAQAGQQGQGGQQGQQGQGQQGQAGGNGRLGQMANGGGRPFGNIGNNPAINAPLGDLRQLRDRAGQLSADAQALRRQLQASGGRRQDLAAMDDVIRALRELDRQGMKADPRELAELSTAALDKLRKLEFELRKRTDTTSDALYLSGADDAPPQYRSLIDEYYRALSKGEDEARAGRPSGN